MGVGLGVVVVVSVGSSVGASVVSVVCGTTVVKIVVVVGGRGSPQACKLQHLLQPSTFIQVVLMPHPPTAMPAVHTNGVLSGHEYWAHSVSSQPAQLDPAQDVTSQHSVHNAGFRQLEALVAHPPPPKPTKHAKIAGDLHCVREHCSFEHRGHSVAAQNATKSARITPRCTRGSILND